MTGLDRPRERVQLRQRVARPPWLHAVALFVLVRAAVAVAALITAHARGRPRLFVLERFDAQWYAGIADHGYGFTRMLPDGRVLSDYAFFPLMPALERAVAWCTGTSALTAGLIVSNLAAVVAAAGIAAVTAPALGNRAAAITTVAWALVPVGFVETMGYSESLFTALSAWSLHAIRCRRYRSAAVLACAAGLTRPLGLAIVAAVVVAVLRDRPRPLSGRNAVPWLTPVLVAPLGAAAYLCWVGARQGSPLGYFHVASGWQNTVDGGVGFARWIGHNFTGATPLPGIALVLALALLALATRAVVVGRYPLPVKIYTVVIVVMALTTSGYFGSKPRYLLPAFPLLFPVAAWLERQPAQRRIAAFTLALVGACAVAAVTLLGSGPP